MSSPILSGHSFSVVLEENLEAIPLYLVNIVKEVTKKLKAPNQYEPQELNLKIMVRSNYFCNKEIFWHLHQNIFKVWEI